PCPAPPPSPTRRSSDLNCTHTDQQTHLHRHTPLTTGSRLMLSLLIYVLSDGRVGRLLDLLQLRASYRSASAEAIAVPLFSLALRSEEHTSELQSRENIV